MSDTSEYTPEVDPVIDGQVEFDGDTATEQVEYDYFNVDEFGDKYVKLSVSGDEVDVPLKEAISGYQRQADYTRKTQELADQRKELAFAQAIQEALDNNPSETIALLQQHYGVQEKDEFFGEDEFLDPMEQQYRTLDTRIRAFEEAQALQELEQTVSSLQNRYGEIFDANEVVAKALATGSTDLEAVFKQIAFDKVLTQQSAQSNYQAQKSAEEQAIIEQKRQAAIVSGGASAKNASSGSDSITSLRDAFSEAKRQLGIS
jgi:predicted metal-dependent hydrolase